MVAAVVVAAVQLSFASVTSVRLVSDEILTQCMHIKVELHAHCLG